MVEYHSPPVLAAVLSFQQSQLFEPAAHFRFDIDSVMFSRPTLGPHCFDEW